MKIRLLLSLFIGLLGFANIAHAKIEGLCPAGYASLDDVANKADVTPKDLKAILEADSDLLTHPTPEEANYLYTCLTFAAPQNARKNDASESEREKVLSNLRKLAGFVNNIPSGSKAEAGLESAAEAAPAAKENAPASNQKSTGSSAIN